MNKQELIEKYEEYENGLLDFEAKIACQNFLKDLQQLDEPEKVKVPQFVADVIEGAREHSPELEDALHYACSNGSWEFTEWYQKKSNRDLFARAWLNGYEVEKEKRYRVKIKNVYHGDLGHAAPFEQFSFYTKERNQSGIRYEFTRKELEEAGFCWVFDCEGIEIEEVE